MSDEYQPVQAVSDVAYALTQKPPHLLRLAAEGVARSRGWAGGGQFKPRQHEKPPTDGLWDFDLVGTPPAGTPSPGETRVLADVAGYEVPPWFRGVRVHALTNSIESTSGESVLALANWVPFPWARGVASSQPLTPLASEVLLPGDDALFADPPDVHTAPIAVLFNRPVRIFETGALLTMDRRPDRVNIELTRGRATIVRIYFG